MVKKVKTRLCHAQIQRVNADEIHQARQCKNATQDKFHLPTSTSDKYVPERNNFQRAFAVKAASLFATFSLCAAFVMPLSGCAKDTERAAPSEDTDITLIDVPTPGVASSDVTASGTEESKEEFSYREVEPTDNPTICGAMYDNAKSFDDLFATTAVVVCGEVTGIKEYETTHRDSDGLVTTNYISGVKFKVEKCFGGKKDLSGKTINIHYGVSQHRKFDDCFVSLKKGKRYYLFMLYAKDCYAGKEYLNDYIKDFPYILPKTAEHIIESYKDGWNIAVMEKVGAGTFDIYSTQKRPKKVGSAGYVEKIINENLDKMRGMSPVQYSVEKLNQNNN